MFIRKVSLHLKPDAVGDFTAKLDNDVIPLLRKQRGFRDEIAFTAEDGKEAVGISFWDSKESADAYKRGAYLQVVKMLDEVAEGPPRVETYEVSNSTFHKTLARRRN